MGDENADKGQSPDQATGSGIRLPTELYALGRSETESLAGAIQAARGEEGLKRAAGEVRAFAACRVAQGVGAGLVCRWLSRLNDCIVQRAVELARSRFDLPEVAWCWLSFGSEGRLEQTLLTDQDNGLIFEADSEARAAELRQAFLPFARETNRLLDKCGFALCRGGVMAGNPRWCLSLQEWQACFQDWMLHADPTALLNATIFFDLRPLTGATWLADELQSDLLTHAAAFPLFLHLMAANALACEPPLGHIRDFVVDRRTGRLDLKRDGSRLFVDAARIFALAQRVPEAGTEARLRAAGKDLHWPPLEVDAFVAAFRAIQSLRLSLQLDGTAGQGNLLDPASLNEMDRAMLKEAFRQARHLQERLRQHYPP